MTTYYVDFEGGNDSNDGTSFANRKKTFVGICSQDEQTNLGAGDEVRVMGQPITSIGNATWTSGGYNNRQEDGTSNANRAIEGASNATPIVITDNGHGNVTGDVVFIYGVQGNTAANGAWQITKIDDNTYSLNNSSGNGDYVGGSDYSRRINHKVLKIPSALTKSIACGRGQAVDGSWVESSNVTVDETSSRWCGDVKSTKFVIAGGFGTGKAAYFPTGTLDLSGFQQISFWMKYENNPQTVNNALSLRLCTDTAGDTTAHTVNIPRSMNYTNQWRAITVDLGTNLNSAIKSIALYVEIDDGALEIHFDHIIACKAKGSADAISNNSLFSKNNTAEPHWHPVHHIYEDFIVIGNGLAIGNNHREHLGELDWGYAGTSETVTTYITQPYRIDTNTTGTGTDGAQRYRVDSRTDHISVGSTPIKILGGWDQTDMTTQNCITWIQSPYRDFTAVQFQHSHKQVDRYGVIDGGNGAIYLNNTSVCSATNIHTIRGRSGAYYPQFYRLYGKDNILNKLYSGYTQSYGMSLQTTSTHNGDMQVIDDVITYGNQSVGIYGFNGATFLVKNWRSFHDRHPLHAHEGTKVIVDSPQIKGGEAPGQSINGSHLTYLSPTLTNLRYDLLTPTSQTPHYGTLAVYKWNGSANDHRVEINRRGLFRTESSVRHTASGLAWRLTPTYQSTSNANTHMQYGPDYIPPALTVLKVAVTAGKLVTVKAWLRRDNTNLNLRLRLISGKQPLIASSDVTASCTANADTWEQVTLTFTPTNSDVAEIDFEGWGGTQQYNGYIDDITVTQAP